MSYWIPDGSYLGAGFSKHLLQIMSFRVDVGFRVKIEAEAHRGSVNDIAYYTRNETLFIVTCGNDRLVKIWNETNCRKQFITLEGHNTSVRLVSFCQGFVFSAENSRLMKKWEVDAPGKESEFDLYGCFLKNVLSNREDGASLFTSEEDRDSLSSIREWSFDDKCTSLVCKRISEGLHGTYLDF